MLLLTVYSTLVTSESHSSHGSLGFQFIRRKLLLTHSQLWPRSLLLMQTRHLGHACSLDKAYYKNRRRHGKTLSDNNKKHKYQCVHNNLNLQLLFDFFPRYQRNPGNYIQNAIKVFDKTSSRTKKSQTPY